MSFGVSISDVAMVVNLAWSTLEGAKKACGEHDELTKQLSSLHLTLEHLQSEVANRNSVINSHTGGRRRDLETHIRGCLRHLKRIGSVLTKYNRLQDESGNLWQRIQFGTKGVKDVSESQLKLSTYTTAITLTLHLLSLGSQGRVEKELSRQRGEAKGLRASINLLLAKQNVVSREGTQDGSIRSNPHEEREFWRSFRKELADEGLKSSVIHAHKSLIKAYVKEYVENIHCSPFSLIQLLSYFGLVTEKYWMRILFVFRQGLVRRRQTLIEQNWMTLQHRDSTSSQQLRTPTTICQFIIFRLMVLIMEKN
ncbi:hypothetical protein BKA64DRAFT_412710 [Cadophora sp. MPI-SDFR-AT-0126]|nr:hypothetical protein BKA64DRAFT_412710 [Leotiomycetes sp. MPI-SDFR-AT-0126]